MQFVYESLPFPELHGNWRGRTPHFYARAAFSCSSELPHQKTENGQEKNAWADS